MKSLDVLAFMFQSRLKELIPTMNIRLVIKIIKEKTNGYDCCMARVHCMPVISKKPKRAIPDINKRCKRRSFDMGLCKGHIKKLRFGLVNEYPPEFLIDEYRDFDNDIEKKINLKHKLFYIKKNIKKNNVKDIVENSFMSFERMDTKIEQILNQNSRATKEDILQGLATQRIIDISRQTIGERTEMLKDLEKKKDKYLTHKKGIIDIEEYLKSIKIQTLPNVKIIDSEHLDCNLYIMSYKDTEFLLTIEKHIVGSVRCWIDIDDEIPEEHKINHTIINPNNNMPIMEYVIDEGSNIYCNISHGVYREYEYNENLEAFMITNNIIQ